MEEKRVKVGNLYLCEYDEENIIPQAIYPALLFDEDRGNLHFYPSNIKLAEFCSKVIEEKLEEILKEIKEKCKIVTPQSKSRYYGTHLFDYLRVYGENTAYDLTGIRFFFDQNDQVNCILLRFQIEICRSGSNNIDNETRIKKYPPTPDDGEGNACYYNLDVDIHSPAEEIAEKFLKFVWEKEAENNERRTFA